MLRQPPQGLVGWMAVAVGADADAGGLRSQGVQQVIGCGIFGAVVPRQQDFNVRQVVGLQKFVLRGTVHVAGDENIFFPGGGQDREAPLVVLSFPYRRQDRQYGAACGEVHFILYKGNHYHLTIRSEFGDDIFVDTDDIWDKGDLVGISLPADAIKIERRDE